MAIEVKVPKISEGVESAEVTEILVSKGDNIEAEESIIVVETDKASVEVPSSDGGMVKEIKVKVGDDIKVGDVILILEEADEKEEKKDQGKEEVDETGAEKVQEEREERKGEKKEEEEEEEPEEKTEKEKEKVDRKEEEPDELSKERSDEVHASPSVRRLARELGVEIKAIAGSGNGDRITEEDVKAQVKENMSHGTTGKLSLPDFSQWGPVEKEPLSNIRRTTASNLTAFWQSIPHVFQFGEAHISGIEEFMEKRKEKAEAAGGKLTITAILVKIAANALQQFPKFNASIDMEKKEMIMKKYINIGIAVDTDRGLLVPVIRNVDKKSVIELATEITGLAEKTRDQKLSPEDMQGGNFTISNLGGIGGTNFTPVVYHPQVAILGVSKASIQPVFVEGSFEPQRMLPLCLSYDHRLIDGAEGAKFLRWICLALEDPYRALFGA